MLMETTHRTPSKRVETPTMSAMKRFGGYKAEEPIAERPVILKKEPGFEALMDAWKSYEGDGYERILEKVKGLEYCARDIWKFTTSLIAFDDEHMINPGTFLSAAINNCPDSEFRLDLPNLIHQIHGIGFRNSKSIHIHGDVETGLGREMTGGSIVLRGRCGDNIGTDMKGGRITVFGNLEWACDGIGCRMKGGTIRINGHAPLDIGGNMEDGRIIVKGDVLWSQGDNPLKECSYVGDGMKGGKIEIFGRVDTKVGEGMEGGTIILHKDFGGIGNVVHGKIFHKGKLIVDK